MKSSFTVDVFFVTACCAIRAVEILNADWATSIHSSTQINVLRRE